MADTPQPGTGLSELLRHFTPYAPIVAGAVMSMAFGERLTIRGKVLSAVVGLGAAFWIAPACATWRPCSGPATPCRPRSSP